MKTMMTTKAGSGLRSTITKGMIMLFMFIGLTAHNCLAQQKKGTAKGGKNAETEEPSGFTVGKEASMRKLWNDHIVWTRQYMISEMNNLPDKEAVLTRLRANARSISEEMSELHPSVDEQTMVSMLDSTVLFVTKLIFETNVGGTRTGAYETKEVLMKLMDRMALYLNSVNEGWKLPEMKMLLQGYLNETHNEILARKNQIWDADIAAYDRLNNHVLKIADAFASGTIQLDSPKPLAQDGKAPDSKNGKNPNAGK